MGAFSSTQTKYQDNDLLTLLGGGGLSKPPLRENLHNSLLKLFFGVQKAMTFQSKVGLNFWNHFWQKKSQGDPIGPPKT